MLMTTELPRGLASIFHARSSCIKKDAFFYFLRNEVTRAERYGFFVSLIVLKIDTAGLPPRAVGSATSEVAGFLSSQLRETDYVGYLDKQTLGVILLNAKPENTRLVMQRLRNSLFQAGIAKFKDQDLRVASVVYPTETNSFPALYERALERLGH